MCYYIAHNIIQDSSSFEEKVITLRDFVNENVRPFEGYDVKLDRVEMETLLSGIGWCDQQARVFIMLACRIGISARLLYLMAESGQSPHSIAEALAPDNRWVIVDISYKLDLINKEGKFASQSDIKNDLDIITNNKRVKLRLQYDLGWADSKFLAIYYNTPIYPLTKKGKKIAFLESIPLKWIRPIVNIIQNRYLKQIRYRCSNVYEFKIMKARGYHLLGYYEKSENLYNDIIKNSDISFLIYKAQFYEAILLKEQRKYQEADKYINEIIKKEQGGPYLPYLLGLRARILEKMGKFKEAEEILKQAQYSLTI